MATELVASTTHFFFFVSFPLAVFVLFSALKILYVRQRVFILQGEGVNRDEPVLGKFTAGDEFLAPFLFLNN